MFGNRLNLSQCQGNPIKHYSPASSYFYSDFVNANKSTLNPSNWLSLTSNVFTNPVYIYNNGSKSNVSRDDRIAKNHVFYKINCQYYDDNLANFSSYGMSYSNFTPTNYYTCLSTHLSDFSQSYYYIAPNYTIDNRFYFMYYPQIYRCWDNYINNNCIRLIYIIAFVYLILLFVFFLVDYIISKNEDLLDFIKIQIYKELFRYLVDDNIFEKMKHNFAEGQKDLKNNPETDKILDKKIDREAKANKFEKPINSVESPVVQKEGDVLVLKHNKIKVMKQNNFFIEIDNSDHKYSLEKDKNEPKDIFGKVDKELDPNQNNDHNSLFNDSQKHITNPDGIKDIIDIKELNNDLNIANINNEHDQFVYEDQDFELTNKQFFNSI